ncbi:hypothetical protein MMC06_003574 [Schaereria dolodes]|nr:hypothetical protein [Schaereria dolodes]
MIFKDGGAYDFHATFERMKETLSQAIEVARESGHMTGNQGQMHGVDLSAVHLEQLPAYEDITENAPASPPPLQRPIPISPPRNGQYGPPQQNVMVEPPDREETRSYLNGALQSRQSQPPSEPPPGYEEVQQNSVVHNLEASVHRAQ